MVFWLREADPEHVRYLELASERLDGTLDPAASRHLDDHLAHCPNCRARLDELAATRSLTRSLPALSPRRSFTLTPALIERRRTRRHADRFGHAAMAAAAAFAIAVGSTFALSDPGLMAPKPALEQGVDSARTFPPAGGDNPEVNTSTNLGPTSVGAADPGPLRPGSVAQSAPAPQPVTEPRATAIGSNDLTCRILPRYLPRAQS